MKYNWGDGPLVCSKIPHFSPGPFSQTHLLTVGRFYPAFVHFEPSGESSPQEEGRTAS